MENIAVLGCTGSIGTQALEVAALHPDRFRVKALTAHSNADKLFELVMILFGFYVLYAFQNVFDCTFTAEEKRTICCSNRSSPTRSITGHSLFCI